MIDRLDLRQIVARTRSIMSIHIKGYGTRAEDSWRSLAVYPHKQRLNWSSTRTELGSWVEVSSVTSVERDTRSAGSMEDIEFLETAHSPMYP